jgi:hypothetical protein
MRNLREINLQNREENQRESQREIGAVVPARECSSGGEWRRRVGKRDSFEFVG